MKNRVRYEINPFMDVYGQSIMRRYRSVNRISIELIDTQSGQVMNAEIPKELENIRDGRPFIKVMQVPEVMAVLREMPPASHRLFYYILERLEYDSDSIILNGYKVQMDLEYKSINSIYKALDGLIESNILAPKEGGTWLFWINPNIIFVGDAIALYKSHMLQKKMNSIGRNIKIAPRVDYQITKEGDPADVSTGIVEDNAGLPDEFDTIPIGSAPIDKEVDF